MLEAARQTFHELNQMPDVARRSTATGPDAGDGEGLRAGAGRSHYLQIDRLREAGVDLASIAR
jgi:hypothetical protein